MEDLGQSWKKLSLSEEEDRKVDLTSNKKEGKCVLVAKFSMNLDVEKVLMGETWSFDRHLVVLGQYDRSIEVNELKFRSTFFWVQIHGLPYSHLNVETALKFGDSLGVVSKPKDISEMKGGTFMRVRVEVDVMKPLCRGRHVTWDEASEGWIYFKYERLPNICYWCGHLSHNDKDCIIWLQSKGSM
ncbi:uncharacterized protein LOC136062418 [Quercus suber]|uniref:uncharacterized protein LOC136062418 n=1 Tax=Quercus suber TaxID=58331 RepID=UPI0032DFFC4D